VAPSSFSRRWSVRVLIPTFRATRSWLGSPPRSSSARSRCTSSTSPAIAGRRASSSSAYRTRYAPRRGSGVTCGLSRAATSSSIRVSAAPKRTFAPKTSR
jgi:hypothetical protein